jgi:SelR domain
MTRCTNHINGLVPPMHGAHLFRGRSRGRLMFYPSDRASVARIPFVRSSAALACLAYLRSKMSGRLPMRCATVCTGTPASSSAVACVTRRSWKRSPAKPSLRNLFRVALVNPRALRILAKSNLPPCTLPEGKTNASAGSRTAPRLTTACRRLAGNTKLSAANFTRPLEAANIVENVDISRGMTRTEVRSKHGDSHLGHVFPDGPRDEGGLTYRMNSASLRFIHRDQLESEGYGEYAKLFAKQEA